MNTTVWLITAIILIAAIFIPRVGLIAIYKTYRIARERELVEDALKHLLDREQHARQASPESLAGTLNLQRTTVMKLIEDMETQGLLESRGSDLHLTTQGERWALHVVRAHRLWERYLTDEARMPLGKIHGESERREHSLTEAQLDDLDAALGHPTRDPHGDPIPTREGTLLKAEGMPLTAWQAEGPMRIVHLEDEPALAFEQILAAGLRLGQTIRILDRNPQRYLLTDGETEFRLAPAVAANVSVAALPESETSKANAISLAELTYDQKAEIVLLDEAVQGFTRRRFLDLGLTPGTVIYPELKNFFGDPRAYRVRGTLIALRKDQAAQIWVKPM
ncbi:MAG: metal-dependent transcriptional regulator [Anaerolineales bacterium]|uniref:metal-dependent transcriptional regulator n=1 Tax=Candidatus Villigracilis proximus TaxID=3140683 RepID=UPI0031371987|nr:metal-dependent transcriptional regulator [Anaerolineales bacterium]